MRFSEYLLKESESGLSKENVEKVIALMKQKYNGLMAMPTVNNFLKDKMFCLKLSDKFFIKYFSGKSFDEAKSSIVDLCITLDKALSDLGIIVNFTLRDNNWDNKNGDFYYLLVDVREQKDKFKSFWHQYDTFFNFDFRHMIEDFLLRKPKYSARAYQAMGLKKDAKMEVIIAESELEDATRRLVEYIFDSRDWRERVNIWKKYEVDGKAKRAYKFSYERVAPYVFSEKREKELSGALKFMKNIEAKITQLYMNLPFVKKVTFEHNKEYPEKRGVEMQPRTDHFCSDFLVHVDYSKVNTKTGIKEILDNFRFGR